MWVKVQQNYLYLWPIFNSAGIQDDVKQLLDSESFEKVDRAWRRIMAELDKDKTALCAKDIKNIQLTLDESELQLEIIQKNLNEFLERKRLFFPRFFFLSNEDLIVILGDSQKPRRIQEHLKKCFEGINEVEFNDRAVQDVSDPLRDVIKAMKSKTGEVVKLVNPINPQHHGGQVERWLLQLE